MGYTVIHEQERTTTVDRATALPPASLIICSRNRPALLLRSVESVLRGDAVPAELIIIDQSDEPHPILATLRPERDCTIRYVRAQVAGLSPANNLGMRHARHGIFVFTHDDVEVATDWFSTLVRALVALGPRTLVTGQALPSPTMPPGNFAPSLKVDARPAVYRGRIPEDPLCPFNMAMYRTLIDEIGGFDECLGAGARFPAAEDNDFGFRLLRAGYQMVYLPNAIIYHIAWRTVNDHVPLQWNYGRGQGAYYAKYLFGEGRATAYFLRRMAKDFAYCLYRFMRLVRHQRNEALGYLTYIAGFLSGAGEWLRH